MKKMADTFYRAMFESLAENPAQRVARLLKLPHHGRDGNDQAGLFMAAARFAREICLKARRVSEGNPSRSLVYASGYHPSSLRAERPGS